jgi:hypothetical protein
VVLCIQEKESYQSSTLPPWGKESQVSGLRLRVPDGSKEGCGRLFCFGVVIPKPFGDSTRTNHRSLAYTVVYLFVTNVRGLGSKNDERVVLCSLCKISSLQTGWTISRYVGTSVIVTLALAW